MSTVTGSPHRRFRPAAGRRLLVTIAWSAWLLGAARATAQFPVIELTSVTPSVGQAGTTFELHVAGGNHLDEVDQLVFSDPRISAELLSAAQDEQEQESEEVEPRWGHFRVSIPDDVPVGRYEVVALGAYGVSNPRIFQVTGDRVIRPDEVSHSVIEPTVLDTVGDAAAGMVVAHQVNPARIDYFRIRGLADRDRQVRLDAQSIDSRMIGQLKLLDADGHLLRTVRGADGFDPSLTLPAGDGRYTVAVQDFLYRGGDRYFYQLRIDAEPPQDAPPLGQRYGGVTGATIPEVFDAGGQLPWIVADDSDEPLEVTPPCVVQSRFTRHRHGPARGRQAIHFEAEAEQRLAIEVVCQRAGQPADPRLEVQRLEVDDEGAETWQAVASEDDPPMLGDFAMRLRVRDPLLLFTAPQSATYRLQLRDLDSGATLDPEPSYWVGLFEPRPDFVLLAQLPLAHNDPAQTRPRGNQMLRGGTASIRVLAFRRDGLTGPIELAVEGLPEGVSASPARIEANQSEAHLTVAAEPEAAAWQGEVAVVGRATHDGQPLARQAAASTVVWGQGDLRDTVHTRLTDHLRLAVTERWTAPLSLSLAEEPQQGAPSSELALPIEVTRRDGGDGAVVLRPRNLPPGVTADEVTIAADQSSGAITLKIAADAKPGHYTPWFLGESKVKFQAVGQDNPGELTVFIPTNTTLLRITEPE